MCTLKEHNKEPYRQIVEMFKTSNLCLYVSATGTGKSYVTSKLIEDFDYNTLVICPKRTIARQWKNVADVDTITYQKFYRFNESKVVKLMKKYDLVVVDEAHHAGAERWGANIIYMKESANNYGIKILGLTADPNRYSDIETDITELIFAGNVVQGYDLTDAITNKVLPNFTYISVLYSFPGELIMRYREKFGSSKLDGKLDEIRNTDRINEIIHRHLPKGNRKVVVFVSQIKDIEPMKDLMEYIFDGEELSIFSIHSNKSAKKNDAEVTAFETCASKITILISVNMLNEGVHISDVDTIFMLRKTSSPGIFFQQIGRALDSSGKKNKIRIYDLVGNRYNLTSGVAKCNKSIQDIFDTCEIIRKISEQNIVFDYASEDIKVLREIAALLSGIWTHEEDDILRKYYPTEGPDVYKRLPGRSRSACMNRANELGVKCIKGASWTKEEDDIIRKYYPIEGPDVYKRLPGRTKEGCRARARFLGVSVENSNRWTKEEDDIIRKWYPLEGGEVYKRLPGRSRSACIHRAKRLGLSYDDTWTKEEDDIIRKYYPIEGAKVANRLRGRTEPACVHRARKLGVKYIRSKKKK